MSTSAPAKKTTTTPAAGRRTPATSATTTAATTNSTLSRSPSRMNGTAAPGTAASSTATGLGRTRSVRTGLPPSARAAARKPATPDSAAEEDAKAELQARMEDLQQKLQQAEQECEESRKQATVLQLKLDESLKEQGMLEESVHEQSERINDLENARKVGERAKREMEQIYESERAVVIKEKEEAAAREEEMQASMQRMKETLAQREMRAGLEDDRRPMLSRHSSGRSANPSPNPDGTDRQFAPSSVQRSDSSSRNNSRLVMQKDKVIESLRLELAEAQIKLVEMENMGGGRMQEIQKQLYEIKMQNARLMEENESYQLLLTEKSFTGEFTGEFLRAPSQPRDGSRPSSRDARTGGGTTLADELESYDGSEGGEDTRRLQAEVNSMRDQNKALTLYINNIISRLLQHEQFEQILDKTPDLMAGPGAISRRYQDADTDKDLPPAPPPKDDQPSLLQRAKSVMAPKKPRPLSQQVPADQIEPPLRSPGINEDPETAPSVPLGRSRSTRGGAAGHRRANSDWAAASVVTNMYRGPQQPIGPLSPGLTSATNRNSFFATSRQLSSSSNVPTISETSPDKEASGQQRDSKISSSESNRNSLMSNPGGLGIDEDSGVSGLQSERSNPSSPPRSNSGSGDKDKDKDRPSGAIMMGSKPRPLRLVQEAADEDAAAKKAANRGSWFGWMNKGGSAPGGVGQPVAAFGDKLGGVFGQRKSEGTEPGQGPQ